MIFELIIIGAIGGLISGFFGVGGGTILIPLLLYIGLDIKEAIGISVMQMLFSSLFGSFLNYRYGVLNFKNSTILGIGGLIGALGSGFFIKSIDSQILEYLFLAVILFSIYRFFHAPVESNKEAIERNDILLFIGIGIGFIAISLGIGGALLLTPILVSFLHFHIKRAVSLALFFVVFSSASGFISLSYNNLINYKYGLIVALFSLLGVYLGISLNRKTSNKKFKNYILILNIIILILLLNRIFFD